MKKNQILNLILIGVLISATLLAIGYSSQAIGPDKNPPQPLGTKKGPLSLTGRLIQDKIHTSGDGTVTLALTLKADQAAASEETGHRNMDMIVVLDRSGSMEGRKIKDAKQALDELLSRLTPQDRFALVSYSDRVTRHSGLQAVTETRQHSLKSLVREIRPGGSTNLGAGLKDGLDILSGSDSRGNLRRVILISDGLANRGLTDPRALGRLASRAAENAWAVTTVGVGLDFNEQLMTVIADQGAGNYYYLETPAAFAEAFQKEFQGARTAVAAALEVRVPVQAGLKLTDASGYPITMEGNQAVFRPGDLIAGGERKLFLTFKAPVDKAAVFEIGEISVSYLHRDQRVKMALPRTFRVTCVDDRAEALASIDKEMWEDQVLRNDFNKLKEEVAQDIKSGQEKEALDKINGYYQRQQEVNEAVESEEVKNNLDRDLSELRQVVTESFQGPASEVQKKMKSNSKAMQHEGYKGRRSSF